MLQITEQLKNVLPISKIRSKLECQSIKLGPRYTVIIWSSLQYVVIQYFSSDLLLRVKLSHYENFLSNNMTKSDYMM
jgi:hypothetical protein